MDFHYLLALLSGGLVGLLLGATGGGGSLVAIPLLVYVVGVPVQNATAMSLIVVMYSSLFGAWQESRHQRVHVASALMFSLTGMVGAWVGAHGHQLVPETLVLFLFGHLLLFISVWTFRKNHEGEQNDTPSGCAKEFSDRCALKALAFGWGVGLLTGFFGVGGGFLIVPALMYVMGFPIRLAIGTSLLIIALISIGGVAGHLKVAYLDFVLTGLVLLGSLLGLMYGSYLTRFIPAHHLRRGVAILIGVIGMLLVVANGWHLLF
ncbi:MAG: permease [Nitrospirae bacterium CG_4_9_14_3_um_filter_51_5]|nr:MAG: permease [Nitrospirae bacterium CG_4_9_14_3_um_filter_51_5]